MLSQPLQAKQKTTDRPMGEAGQPLAIPIITALDQILGTITAVRGLIMPPQAMIDKMGAASISQ